jgi:hypothetical protein
MNTWVPQRNGSFVRPAEASRDLLPDGFSFDFGSLWLRAIHFGEEVERKSEEHRRRQAVATELGFPDDATLERARRFAALPAEDQERILADQNCREVELPDHEPANSDRRADRVATQAAAAPDRITEERTRSISVGREAVKEEAAQYLRQQYTSNGDVFCQICKGPMPFKLDDGSNGQPIELVIITVTNKVTAFRKCTRFDRDPLQLSARRFSNQIIGRPITGNECWNAAQRKFGRNQHLAGMKFGRH